MADEWTWDETLYAGSAPYYATGRVAYPTALADAIARALRLGGRERLLDVGCGPSSLTLLLASRVGDAVGIDADPGMLVEACAAAARSGADNVRWRRMRGEELPGDLGAVDVATFAQSFHWMQRSRVARLVRAMLTPGGACVHVGATTHRGDDSRDPLPLPRPPHEAIAELVASHLGPLRRAGRSLLRDGPPGGEPAIFRAAGFDGPERLEVPRGEVVTRSVDEVVAATFSLSSSTPHLLGARRPEFERELRELLAATADDGRFGERLRGITVDVWRPA